MRKFTVVLEEDEDGVYCVHVPALSGCHTQGKTRKEALKNAREAISCYLESLGKDSAGSKAIHKVDVATVAV
jgi:predicted RNase H-like HicB family nuclease